MGAVNAWVVLIFDVVVIVGSLFMGNCFSFELCGLVLLLLLWIVVCYFGIVGSGGGVWFFQFVEVYFGLLVGEGAVFDQVYDFHGC